MRQSTMPLESALPTAKPPKLIGVEKAIYNGNKRRILEKEYVNGGVLKEGKWKMDLRMLSDRNKGVEE